MKEPYLIAKYNKLLKILEILSYQMYLINLYNSFDSHTKVDIKIMFSGYRCIFYLHLILSNKIENKNLFESK